MYHDITVRGWQAGGGPERFSVPADEFARQLDQLGDEGYVAASVRRALGPGAENIVAVTFDDGSAGQYERGFRALSERGMTATFFVTTDWVDRPGFVTWAQLREMRSAGMEIQSHGSTHRFLSELAPSELVVELQRSKDALDSKLDQDTDTLSLPGGDWPQRAQQHLIAAAGYRVVATSQWGLNGPVAPALSGVVAVKRCTVKGVVGATTFRRIASGDPWLRRRRRVREGTLRALRSVLGATRYARVRKLVLDHVPI